MSEMLVVVVDLSKRRKGWDGSISERRVVNFVSFKTSNHQSNLIGVNRECDLSHVQHHGTSTRSDTAACDNSQR